MGHRQHLRPQLTVMGLALTLLLLALTFPLLAKARSQPHIKQAEQLAATAAGTALAPASLTGSGDAGFSSIEGQACPGRMSSYWKLDETDGAPFNDARGNLKLTCTLQFNCPIGPVKGRVNYGRSFSSASKTKLSAPASASLNWGPNDNFSIELWMKGKAGQSCMSNGNNEVLIGRNDSISGLQWWLGCENSGGRAIFFLRATTTIGSDQVILASPASIRINDGGWYHLAAVRDGTNKINRLYVDGVEVDAEAGAVYSTGFSSLFAALTVGGLNSGSGNHFNGIIDEVALYDKVLSPAEVAGHYNNGIPRAGYCGGPFAPTIISTPVQTGQISRAYRYQVEAVGSPPSKYRLLAHPSGMTIDAGGLISWTPIFSDIYRVEVSASNPEGSDTQDFTINVTAGGSSPQVYLPVVMKG